MNKQPAGVRADRKSSYEKMELFASHVRNQLGLAPGRALNGLELFDGLDELTVSLGDGTDIQILGRVIDLDYSEGYTKYDREKGVLEILASKTTYEWLEAGYPRASYFVAHELGHCVLHTDQLVRLSKLPTNQQAAFHRGRVEHKHFEDTEWQANAFASALLMPAKGLAAIEERYSMLTASIVVRQYDVSDEAARYRLHTFEKHRAELLR